MVAFVATHNTWRVHFNEENARPHRAYGKGISTTGTTLQDRALNFIVAELEDFNIPVADLRLMGESSSLPVSHLPPMVRYFLMAPGWI